MSKLIIDMEVPVRCAECDIVQKTKTGYRCPIASKMHGFSCVAGRGQLGLPYYCPIDGVLPEDGFSGGVSEEITKEWERYLESERAAEKIAVEEDLNRRRRELEESKRELEELKRRAHDEQAEDIP